MHIAANSKKSTYWATELGSTNHTHAFLIISQDKSSRAPVPLILVVLDGEGPVETCRTPLAALTKQPATSTHVLLYRMIHASTWTVLVNAHSLA